MNCEQAKLCYAIRDSLYLNISNRCTLECQFCPKTKGSLQLHDYDLSLNRQPSAEEVIAQLPNLTPFQEVVFCGYGEPTLRLKVLKQVAQHCKSLGISTRLNTDGLGNLVHKRNILPELAPCIDAISISLNAQSASVYEHHCQPKLNKAYDALLDLIKLAPQYIRRVQVTAIDGLSEVDIAECKQIAETSSATFLARQLDVLG